LQNEKSTKITTIGIQESDKEYFAELRNFLLNASLRYGYSNWNWNIRSLLNWHRYERIVDEVSKLSLPGFLLDVGCGFGQITEMLRSKNMKVIGLDIGAPSAVKREWRKSAEISNHAAYRSIQNKVWKHLLSPFVLGDGCTLPFANGTFDAVVCCGVLEHVYDPRRFLEECGRVIKNNGLFLCYYLPNKTGIESLSSRFFSLPTIHQFYDKNMIEPLFGECGYEVLKVTREHLIPEPRFNVTIKIWNKSRKAFTWLDDVLAKTQLQFFGDNWKVCARKKRTSNT